MLRHLVGGDAAKLHITHRTAPGNNHPAPNITSAELEKTYIELADLWGKSPAVFLTIT